jgi:hypothetical protein
MKDRIPSKVLGEVITLGRATEIDEADQPILDRLASFDWVNRLGIQGWESDLVGLNECELECLIRALVILEERSNWVGGSVSGAIWAFVHLRGKDSQRAETVAEWCMKNSTNPYIPFGSFRGGARSLTGFDDFQENKANRQARGKAVELADQERKQLRDWLRIREHRRRLHVQKAEVEARERYLSEFSTLEPLHRLVILSMDEVHPPDFYPPEFFPTDEALVARLTGAQRESLLGKHGSQRWWKKWHSWLHDRHCEMRGGT